MDHFHSICMVHLMSAEKLQKQLTYNITFPCPKKHNYRKIGLIQVFRGEQKQSVLQRWVRRSVKRMVILTFHYTTQAVRGPITKIKQSKCSIAGPIFSKYWTGHCPE